MLQDVRFGLKLLYKEKAFTITALLTLALCIGANTAIFTVLHAVILAPLPYEQPDRLLRLYNIYPGVGVYDRGSNGIPDYLDRKQLTEVFDSVALYGENGYDAGPDGSPAHIPGEYVTPSFFHVLRVSPMLGRTFEENDAVKGKDQLAILSYGLWKDMYAMDAHILGKDIRLNGRPYRVVGVMPRGFEAPASEARLWVPFAFTPRQMSDDARHSNNWDMIARLRPGVSIAYAQQRVDALNKENIERYPKYRTLLKASRFATKVVGLKDLIVLDVRPILYLLQAAVSFVLLIGCVNVANLLLVRSNVRRKELAIRFSLGAGRWRLGRQLLVESLTLASLGGALGILTGYAGVRLLFALGAKELPRSGGIHMDPAVLAFSAGAAIVTGLVFGSVPVFQLFRRDFNESVRTTERAATAGRGALFTRSALVVVQVSLAFVLLIGAGLLTLSFARLLSVNPGFQSEHVLTASFALPGSRYKKDDDTRAFVSSLLRNVRSQPGVTHAATATDLPFTNNTNSSVITLDSHPLAPGELPPVPAWNTIDSDYFRAMSIPLIEGRPFSEADTEAAPRVAIIDQFLARKYWPGRSAIGERIHRGLDNNEDKEYCTIVGVVASIKSNDLAEHNPVGEVYFSYKQFPNHNMHLVVRSNRDDPRLGQTIHHLLAGVDAQLPLFDVKTMPERISASTLNRRAAMAICLVFAALALVLAAVGIYGVLAYSVAQRTREFGIRVALGARTGNVISMVLGEGMRLAAAGLIIGAAGALAATRLMTAMLYEVKPTDPTVFVLVAVALLGVALAASLIPSARAVRIRPSEALRVE